MIKYGQQPLIFPYIIEKNPARNIPAFIGDCDLSGADLKDAEILEEFSSVESLVEALDDFHNNYKTHSHSQALKICA